MTATECASRCTYCYPESVSADLVYFLKYRSSQWNSTFCRQFWFRYIL